MRTSSFRNGLWLSVLLLGAPGLSFVACALAPSHTPLGGNYATLETVSPERQRRQPDAGTPSADSPSAAGSAPDTLARATPTPSSSDGGSAPESSDTVRYEPFKSGDQIRAEVSFGIAAEVQGSSSDLRGNNKIALDAKLRVDLKVVKASAQSLDQLEVTLTPISLHTDFDGQSSDSKQDPPETYDVTLSGQTPSIHARSGATLEKEDRATLIVLITPLVEFHNRWARAPSLTLKSGWSAKIPLSTPSFMTAPGDSVKVGPLSVRYEGRDRGASNVPFELSLPIEWSSDMGRLSFDFTGRAKLGAKGRPIALDLSGALSGNAGPASAQIGLRGTAKFVASLSYP